MFWVYLLILIVVSFVAYRIGYNNGVDDLIEFTEAVSDELET